MCLNSVPQNPVQNSEGVNVRRPHIVDRPNHPDSSCGSSYKLMICIVSKTKDDQRNPTKLVFFWRIYYLGVWLRQNKQKKEIKRIISFIIAIIRLIISESNHGRYLFPITLWFLHTKTSRSQIFGLGSQFRCWFVASSPSRVTDALHWEITRIIQTWDYRWSVEVFHEFSKQITGLESSQVRKEEAVKRHFRLSCVGQSLLQRVTCQGQKSEKFKFAKSWS